MEKNALFRKIPAVDRLMAAPRLVEASSRYPRSLIVRAVQEVLDELRRAIARGELLDANRLEPDRVSLPVIDRLESLDRPHLRPVINATGVIVHTNLGRSILPERVLERLRSVAGGYSNLEYRLDEGMRGSRYSHVEGILQELMGGEAAMVVNNNAAAVLICLETLAQGREAVVSRGQLVEIGGAFRIPDVMKKSGAVMVEVGTTNKTHLRDYEEAISSETGLLLRVHRSNFQLVGFTQDVDAKDLVALGRKHGVPVMEDLGSGCLVDFSRYGLPREPTVQEVLASGVDLVTFSGDKLLGGPQAGVILGRKPLVERIKANPLNRAMRIDKLTLAALEETLRLYRDEETAVRCIPTLGMVFRSYKSLRSRAAGLKRRIGKIDPGNFTVVLADGTSKTGGGALPLLDLPTRLVALAAGRMSAHRIEKRLREHDPPIIARVENDRVLLDVRTIQDGELATVARAVQQLARVPGA
ncbi:MAG: L-seryl-tRNA(Sec) selenium transferase [Deltaproteobacteria bacterium]|nr:L-seryl-tRNA(Sec) selenium transferase [Deltaproteobacteria bacterium]